MVVLYLLYVYYIRFWACLHFFLSCFNGLDYRGTQCWLLLSLLSRTQIQVYFLLS